MTQARVFLAAGLLMSMGATSARTQTPAAVVGPSAPQAHAAIVAPDLLRPRFGVKDVEDKRLYKRSRTVHVDTQLLRRARVGHLIRIKMFDDADFTVRLLKVEVEPHVANTFSWHGKIVGREGSEVILTVHEDAFAAWIFPNDPRFQSLGIQAMRGVYVARELIDAMHEGSVMRAPKSDDVGVQSANCDNDPDKLDVTMVYDVTARIAAGSDANVRAAIVNGVTQANVVMSRSSISSRFIIKSIRNVIYASSGNQSTDLARLSNKTDGFMDSVHAWRRSDASDLVSMVRAGGGGVAYCYNGWGSGFSVNGYSSIPSMVVAHEFGHNLGCGHDPANNTVGNRCINTSYGRGHNWLVSETGFPIYARQYAYTVMSYSSNWGSCSFPWNCAKTRQPNFSSPLVSLRFSSGIFKTGTTTRDNRRTILAFRQRVANFSNAVLGYNVAPTITTQPRSTVVALGYNAPRTLMTVRATGATKYQWRRNGRNIAGQTTNNLTISIANASAALAGTYDCVCSGPCLSTTSGRATLSVGPERVWRRVATPPSGAYTRIANVGDVDGDGCDDFAQNQPSNGNSWWTIWSGRTHEFFISRFLPGGLYVGAGTAAAKLDGDDYSDVLLGAPADGSGRGAIYYLLGREVRQKSSAVRRLAVGSASNSRLGELVTAAHLDAGANMDVAAVGRDELSAFSSSGRRLWAVKPAPGTLIRSLDTVGDVNSDGYDDLVIGMPSYLGNRGRWELRSGRDGARLRHWDGSAGEQRGYAVCGVGGDVDGDGVFDFVSTSPPYTGRGLVQFWSGRTGQFIRSLWGPSTGQWWGRSVSAIGDYDGDGVVDVLAGANGYCAVMSGRTAQILKRWTGGTSFGRQVVGLDANGDSRGDVLVEDDRRMIWKYDRAPKAKPPAWKVYGRTCPGTGGKLPRIGQIGPLARSGGGFRVTLSGARASSAGILKIGVGRTNLPLDALGMPGCSKLYGTSIVTFVRPTDANGRARFGPLAISPDAKFVGVKLTYQWLVLDIGGNPFGLTLSDAGEMKIGAR